MIVVQVGFLVCVVCECLNILIVGVISSGKMILVNVLFFEIVVIGDCVLVFEDMVEL